MKPLIPHLRAAGIKRVAEPCCGEFDLVRHLESFGLTCVYSGDIKTRQDALARTSYGAIDAIITNPPFSRRNRVLMCKLIAHFMRIAPTWLLLPADWLSTLQAAPFMVYCSDVVPIGRVQWIAGSKHSSMENFSWYRFDINHTRPGASSAQQGRRSHPALRAVRQVHAEAIQFAVLLADVQAARPSQEV